MKQFWVTGKQAVFQFMAQNKTSDLAKLDYDYLLSLSHLGALV